MLHVVDYVIIAVFLVGIVGIGVWLSKKVDNNMESYFLGDNKIPFWALAASGISSNVDISGTAINAALLYSLGLKGFYIEFRGGVTLSLALFLVLGKWTRRTRVPNYRFFLDNFNFQKIQGSHSGRNEFT